MTMKGVELVFKLQDNPLRCSAGYQLDAYCKYENPDHGYREFPHTPTDVETYGEAMRALRKHGWMFHRDGTATCPKCAKRLLTK